MWGGLFSEGDVIYPRTGEDNRVSYFIILSFNESSIVRPFAGQNICLFLSRTIYLSVCESFILHLVGLTVYCICQFVSLLFFISLV